MARLNVVGFESGSITEAFTSSGTVSVTTSSPLSGTYSLRCNPTTTGTGYVDIGSHNTSATVPPDHVNDMNKTNVYVNFLFRADTLPASNNEPIFAAYDGTTLKLELRVSSTGALLLYDSSGTLVATSTSNVSAGVEYRIKIHVPTGSSVTVTVSIDDTQVINQSAVNVTTAGTDYIRLGKGTNRNGQTVDFYFDDIIMDDASQPANSLLMNFMPEANGSTMSWTSGPAPQNHTQVDEIPHDSETTYIMTASTTAVVNALFDIPTMASKGINGKTYYSIKPWAFARRTTGGAPSPGVNWNYAGVTYSTPSSTNAVIPSTYSYVAYLWETTFTETDLDGLEIGPIKNGTGGNQQLRCTNTGVYIEYSDSAPAPTAAKNPLFFGSGLQYAALL